LVTLYVKVLALSLTRYRWSGTCLNCILLLTKVNRIPCVHTFTSEWNPSLLPGRGQGSEQHLKCDFRDVHGYFIAM